MSFERLMREHDRLDRLRQALLNLVGGPASPVEALRLLTAFSVEIEQHHVVERAWVYEPLSRIAARDPLAIGIDLQVLQTQMESDWGSYLHDWDLEAITADWASFAEETAHILGRAGERLRLENSLIYPMALREGTIRLREPTG